MTIDLISLLAYEGPNIFGPQPGLLVRLRCDHDYSRRLKDALKDGAQYIGLVMGYLNVSATQERGRWLVSAQCVTPMPNIAAALAEYVLKGLRVEEARAERKQDEDDEDDDDEEAWDRDTPLYNLQRRRRAEAPPLPLLQLEAAARTRDLPLLHRSDSLFQIGYGAQSWAFDAAALATDQPPVPPWERIGRVPLMAIAGDVGRSIAVSQLANTLQGAHTPWNIADDASFADTRALLTDQQTQQALIGLSLAGIATQGLAFDRCSLSAIVDLTPTRPAALLNDEEWVQALGVPMLVTEATGFTVLNADEPLIAALAVYAPCPIVFVSAHAESEVVAAHRAAGGAALFVRGDMLVATVGMQEHSLEAAPEFTGIQLIGALAARALVYDWRAG